jgi:uncharacterized protein YbbC (DUF1343 family)
MEQVVADSIAEKATPGALVLIGRGDEVVYKKTFGDRLVEPKAMPTTPDTVFDLASLTKPIATATSIMILAERGKIALADPVGKYIPAFKTNPITIEQVLLHRAGFMPDNALADYSADRDAVVAKIAALQPVAPPGGKFIYSDVGYILLGELVRIVDGRRIDRFFADEIAGPLGMAHTRYNPPSDWQADMAGSEHLLGRVHDPRAAAMEGVAGHAGLFGTADDLSRFCRMLLNGGELDGHRILKSETVAAIVQNRDGRTYGFDCDTGYSSARGQRFPRGTSFGHTGFTGTVLWLDPASKTYVVLLTNRLHPDGQGNVRALWYAVSTLAAESLLGPAKENAATKTGLDAMVRDGFKPLLGRRVGLITNHTGVDRFGRRDVDLMRAAGVNVVALFSPEHGIAGKLDDKIGSTTDEKTGLTIHSLYGDTKRPTPEMLDGLDTLVFDIQDVGTRFYTYIATMSYAMEEAAKANLRFVVLDRPNPLGGLLVDGPLAEPDKLSFVASQPIPLVHGMTIGELARLINTESGLHAELQIVPLENWKRDQAWDQTQLRWVNPSPNMRSPAEALLYPAVGLLEMTNVSVGRGTETPFELLGAPWIDGPALVAALGDQWLAGVKFEPVEFTPTASMYVNQKCGGVRITVVNPRAYEPARTGLTIAWHLRRLYPQWFKPTKMQVLLANWPVYEAWDKTPTPSSLPAVWTQPLADFLRVRDRYLIYGVK